MAGKRQATSDLNHDNWNHDEEPEERGTFKTASKDELKSRVIKTAKRNLATGSTDVADGGSGAKSVFSGFSGFGKQASASTSAGSAFSFLSKIPMTTGTVSSSTASTATFSLGTTTVSSAASSINSPKTGIAFGSSSAPTFSTAVTTGSTTANFSFGPASSNKAPKAESSSDNNKCNEYYAKLKGLNQSASDWIKTHVDKNPLCILTPIFRDYEKYLKEFEEDKSKAEMTEKKTIPTGSTNAATDTFTFSEANTKATTASTPSNLSTFSFSSSTATSTSNANSLSKTNGLSFSLKKPDETKPVATIPSSSANFSFGLKSSTPATSAPTTGFSFGKPASSSQEGSATNTFSFTPGAAPFTFANIKPPEAPAATEMANDEEDQDPPKNEFKQVVEEDAVYSKKCKVFVKKDSNFVDKGVGTLYLKPIESTGKTQLLVRADTNLGNILVNLILSAGIPSQRMGKNNVMLVCVPTPDVEKTTPMLLRVKTGEEADDLLKNIEKYKN